MTALQISLLFVKKIALNCTLHLSFLLFSFVFLLKCNNVNVQQRAVLFTHTKKNKFRFFCYCCGCSVAVAAVDWNKEYFFYMLLSFHTKLVHKLGSCLVHLFLCCSSRSEEERSNSVYRDCVHATFFFLLLNEWAFACEVMFILPFEKN